MKSLCNAVDKFSNEMKSKLKENSHKSGWDDMEINSIVIRIHQEIDELQEYLTMYNHSHNHAQGDRDKIRDMRLEQMHDEAIDIANFCMFLCHNYPKQPHDKYEEVI